VANPAAYDGADKRGKIQWSIRYRSAESVPVCEGLIFCVTEVAYFGLHTRFIPGVELYNLFYRTLYPVYIYQRRYPSSRKQSGGVRMAARVW
jgi:hypothetical protein